MSARYFCDICTTELTEADLGRVKKRLGILEVEVMHALGNGWNSGHVCHGCIVQAVRNGNAVTSRDRV